MKEHSEPSKEETKTDNELIAEFMRFEKTGTFYETQGLRHDKYKSPDFGYTYPAEWAFNTKWDWLMPVVEKIADLGINDRSADGVIVLSDYHRMLVDMSVISKIDAVYGKVVVFIKWYNDQKK